MRRIFVTFLLALGIWQASFLLGNAVNEDLRSRYILPSGIVKPIAYNVYLSPNVNASVFGGMVNITLVALTTNNTLILNAKFLTVYEVNFVDLNTTTTLKTKYMTDEDLEILKITVRPQFEKDHYYVLEIKYGGRTGPMKGICKSKVIQNGKVTGRIIMTQFKETHARRAFPCWDEPIYKAKFRIHLVHSETLQAVSNMDVRSRQISGNKVITSFKETPPMSTYLVGFVISDFQFKQDQVGNFTYRVWTKNSTINQIDYPLKMSRKILDELNSYTNISYQTYMPDKIDQIPVENSYPVIATENWGLVIYKEGAFLYDEASLTTQKKMDVLTHIAQEFTHQWFGNLVTPKWWKYVWLSEGFAFYIQYIIAHKIRPELRLDDMFVVESMQAAAMIVDAIPGIHPIHTDVFHPLEIAMIFNSIAYEKAASLVRMMSHTMTEMVFQKGLQYYLKSHALGNADSNDLFESLQKALNESGIKWKEPVQVIMQNWLEKPGYPTLTIKRVDGGYQLTQEHFVIVLKKTDKYPTKWWIPITYVEESNPNFTNTTPIDWFSPNNESHILPSMEKTGWFIFNTQQAGYYRVNYDLENWELLMKELNKGNDTKIHAVNRAQMLDDAFNLARIDNLNYTVALNVTLYLTHETDYMPWHTAFNHLNFLRNLLRTSEKYYTFMRYVAYLLKTITNVVGYEPKANDNDLVKMLRVDAMKWACEAGVENCTTYAEKTYEEWLKNPEMKLDVDLKKEILCTGIRNANESAWTTTLEYINASTPDAIYRKSELMVLACSNSSEILRKYLKSTLSPRFPIDFTTAATHVVSKYPAGPDLVLNFLFEEYGRIKKIGDIETVMDEVATAIASGITSDQQHIDLSAFLLDEQLNHSLTHVAVEATGTMMWIHQYKSTVDKWLGTNSNLFECPDNGGDSATTVSVMSDSHCLLGCANGKF